MRQTGHRQITRRQTGNGQPMQGHSLHGLARRGLGLLAGALLLAGCDMMATPPDRPQPGTLRPPAPPAVQPPTEPSEQSRALAVYYQRLQADLLVQGLLRTDGGGIDTPYSARDLARNFELIAFYDEYERGAGLRPSAGRPVPLRRWTVPIRMNVEFGASVPPERRAADRKLVGDFAARLSRVSGHPIGKDAHQPNFHILIYGEDDRATLPARARQLVPGMSLGAQSVFRDLPRSIHCFVMAFSGSGANDYSYRNAIVFIRAEHPDLLRASCVHEELAQGMGLANDTPRARPSIFNDDDEFAFLTSHDELLLRMLYDSRLAPGMTIEQARPIIATMAEELTGGSS